MSKMKYFIAFALGTLILFVLAIAAYCWLPSLFIGGEILENSITTVNNSTSAPKNYRATFAKWEYVVNDSTGKLDKVLVSNTQNSGLTGSNGLLDIGIITEDGSYGRHITDLADFKSKLIDDTSEVGKRTLFLIYKLEASDNATLKKFNLGNLAVACASNNVHEGNPLHWENKDKWNQFLPSNPGYFSDESGIRYVMNNGTKVPIASYVDGAWYVHTEQQLTNLHALGRSHFIYSVNLGCGSVQWSGGRCWGYIQHMYNCLGTGELDFSNKSSIVDCDAAYMIKELPGYIDDYLTSNDYGAISIETLTGFITAKYEKPGHSGHMHWYNNGEDGDKTATGIYSTIKYKGSSGESYIAGPNDFWDGTIKDFTSQHYWIHAPNKDGVTESKVSESTRIRTAIGLYDKYYK